MNIFIIIIPFVRQNFIFSEVCLPMQNLALFQAVPNFLFRRARMEGGTSTLAVTVIENIEHLCEWEECMETHTLADLPLHMRKCSYRYTATQACRNPAMRTVVFLRFSLIFLQINVFDCIYPFRMVECPGLECTERFSLSRLLEHSLYCCVEGHEIPQYRYTVHSW